jgi:hypothetical protein
MIALDTNALVRMIKTSPGNFLNLFLVILRGSRSVFDRRPTSLLMKRGLHTWSIGYALLCQETTAYDHYPLKRIQRLFKILAVKYLKRAATWYAIRISG